jgi:hypothetical protein
MTASFHGWRAAATASPSRDRQRPSDEALLIDSTVASVDGV